MQLVSAAAPKMFSDALATHSPTATLNGQRPSSGGLPTSPWPAPTNSAASAQRKAALCPAAGTTARPQVRRRLGAGAFRRPRAPATSAPVRLFDPRRHDAYAQGTDTQSTDTQSTDTQSTDTQSTDTQSTDTQSTGTQRTGPPAADQIAPTSVRHADGPRVTPSAIRDEPAVGNQTNRLPRACAGAAQIAHFDSPRRNPRAQRNAPTGNRRCRVAPVRHATGPRTTSSAIRDEPTLGSQTVRLPRAWVVAVWIRHFDSPRRNPYAQRNALTGTRPDRVGLARNATVPRTTPSSIRDEPTAGNQVIGLSVAHAACARVDHFEPARRNPYAQKHRTTSTGRSGVRAPSGRPAPDAVCHPTWPSIVGRPIDLAHRPAPRTQVSLSASARRNLCAQRTSKFSPSDIASVPSRPAGPGKPP